MRRLPIIVCVIAVGAVLAVLGAVLNQSEDRRPDARPDDAVRIAAIGPSVAIILKDLGLEDLIVGRHGYDMALDPALPVCGDLNGIDYEALLRTRPTHVVVEWDHREKPARLARLAESLRWEVRYERLATLDEVRACAAQLASLFADELSARGRDPARLLERMDAAWSRTDANLAGAGRVLLLVATNPPGAVGPGSFHHDVLERIGGVGALRDAGAYVTMDVEDVIRLAPDAIVLVIPRPRGAPATDPTPEEIARLLGPLASRKIPAVTNGRVALIDDPLCQTASTALIDFADQLARILRRWSAQDASNESAGTP